MKKLEGEVLPKESTAVAVRGRAANLLQITGVRALPERADAIREYHVGAMTRMAQGAMYALLCGYELHAARAQLRHGQWEAWVAANCPFTTMTAWRYMQAAERKFKEIPNLTRVKDFALGVSPRDLQPEQRQELIEAVRFATDGDSWRQLCLDLGLIKDSPRKALGGYHPRKDQGEDATEEARRMTADESWREHIAWLRIEGLKRKSWGYLDKAVLEELHGTLIDLKREISKAIA
jgi:hypothetical protein